MNDILRNELFSLPFVEYNFNLTADRSNKQNNWPKQIDCFDRMKDEVLEFFKFKEDSLRERRSDVLVYSVCDCVFRSFSFRNSARRGGGVGD